jgi:hypothetical protein
MASNTNMSEQTRQLETVIAPLSQEEERQAIEAVENYLTKDMEGETKSHFRILGVELKIDKPPRPEMVPARLIRVLVVDYGRRRNLNFVVDIEGKVVHVEDYRGLQPAFSSKEIEEAREISLRDDRITRIAKMRGSFVSAFGPAMATEGGNRLIGLHYALATQGQPARILGSVVIDLNEHKVVSVEIVQTEGGHHG